MMTLLQACLIGLLVVNLKIKPSQYKTNHNSNRSKQNRNQNNHELDGTNHDHDETFSASLQNSGIVAGLAILGSGCPTCGTALLTPILGAIFSGSGVALAGKVSVAITVIAVLLALWTLKKLGYNAYVAIVTTKKHKK